MSPWMSHLEAFHPTVPCLGSRPLLLQERALMCGVAWQSVEGLQSDRDLVMSFGNMIPVPLAGVVLQRVLDVWAGFEQACVRPSAPLSDETAEQHAKRHRF